MANVGAVISSIRNIMRQDRGISGDAQRLEQLGWMLFLKIMDDKDQELEVIKDNYVSVIPEKFQWRNWAINPEGITGDELINFIDSNEPTNKGLFLSLREIKSSTNPKRAMIVKEVFDGTNNYMKSGYEMRKVINKLNEIDFTKSEDKHVFGNIYESILQELRDAGNKGEYYTPRAVTQLMTMMTDPKLGEKVLDPAAGTGGFLTAAIDHVRDNYVKTVDDETLLQNSITGWELKPVAYVLGLTNLILHEIDVPDYHYIDSLKKEYNSIGKKDQVDVILANPPFGASIADGVETNFPSNFRSKESAQLFLAMMVQLLNSKGRAAVVLPDGCVKGDGARIRERLLQTCNLHTIIKLPETAFFPATVSTNLLFFEKGEPTSDIWYYQHKFPEGQKSYSKTKPIDFKEFDELIAWWHNRKLQENAWKINVKDLIDFDLDIKNQVTTEKSKIDVPSTIERIKIESQSINRLISEFEIRAISNSNEVKPIRSFLKRVKNPIDIEDDKTYKRVTIKTNHNGISLRDEEIGIKIGTKKQFTVKPNQFLLSKIDARNGAFGIVPNDLNDAIITGNFWTYDVDKSIVDINWFLYFTESHHFIDICKTASTGSTHRKYLDETKFLNHKIKVPTLKEQKAIVGHIQKIRDIQNINNTVLNQCDLLYAGVLDSYFGE